MFKDQRFYHFRITIILLILFLISFVLAHLIQDSHLFGFTNSDGVKENLSFNSSNVLGLFGLTLFTSFFIHFNLSHFLQNIIFFGWFGVLTEKKLGRVNFLLLILSTHVITLLLMAVFIKGNHYFLGSSLGAVSLFSYYTYINKKWGLLAAGISVLILYPLLIGSDKFSIYSHGVSILIGLLISFSTQKFRRFKKS